MTDTTQERPFYEAARTGYESQPRASRMPLYLFCGAAFVAGVIAFFIGGLPDRLGESNESLAALLGFKFGGQLVYAGIIGVAAMAFLSTSQARKLRQRSDGEDFVWPFLSAIGGGLVVMGALIALAAPAMAASKATLPIQQAHVAAMNKDAADYEAAIVAIGDGGVLYGPNLSTDPGYRKATAKAEKMRAIVKIYRQREDDRFADTRKKLAAAVSDTRQRKRILARFDADLARAQPLLGQYWSKQEESVEFIGKTVAILRSSPGEWEGQNFYFRRQRDLDRFRAAEAEGRQLQAEAEDIRGRILALSSMPEPVSTER